MTGRRFSSRPPQLPARPERRSEGHQDQDPATGHPEGIPEFPDALPGSHFYTEPDPVPVRRELDVGPASPYYGKGGMAHGVAAPVRHGGRPTPRPEDRHHQEASRAIVHEETSQKPDPVPVYIVQPQGGAHPLLRAALQQRIVPAAGADPFLLVPRDPARTSVRLLNESPLQASPVTIGNEVTDPGAFTPIAAISAAALAAVAPPGTPVTVSWQVSLQGAVTASDANNMRLVTGSTVLEVAVYPGAAGDYQQESVEFVTVAGQGVSVTSIAAASGASAIYGAQISVTPLTAAAAAVRLTADATLSGGILLPAGMTSYLEIDTQDQMFAYCPSGGPAPVSMISQYQVARGA